MSSGAPRHCPSNGGSNVQGAPGAYTDGAWHFSSVRFEWPSSGCGHLISLCCPRQRPDVADIAPAILFCQPHPYDMQGISSFSNRQTQRASNAPSGSSRFARPGTGVLLPNWLVVDGCTNMIGAAGMQGAGYISSFPSPALVAYHFFTVSTAGCLPMHTINTRRVNGSGTNACHGSSS